MKTEDVIALFDKTLDEATAKGARTIDVDALKQWVAGLRRIAEAQSAQMAAEEQKRTQMSFENWLETNKQRHEWQLEGFRSVIQVGQSALKTCILVNGGAAVALLAFVGHLVEQAKPQIPVRSLALAMAVFVGGVFAGGLASAFTYLSQWSSSGNWPRTGLALNIAAIASGLVSLGCFCGGGVCAYFAIVGR